MTRELCIPRDVQTDPDAWELVRVWADAKGDQHVVISSSFGPGPDAFGCMLAQLARHAARLFEERDGIAITESLRLARQGFDAEWQGQTGTISGAIDQ